MMMTMNEQMKSTNNIICNWLAHGTYRIVMHRHDGGWRAIDESEGKLCNSNDKDDLAYNIENGFFKEYDRHPQPPR